MQWCFGQRQFTWVYLNINKFTCIYLNLPEFTWIYLNHLNLPEFTWIYLNLQEYTRIYPNLPEFIWIYLNVPEFTWIYLNLPEFTLIYLYLPEFTWTYLNLPESTWTCCWQSIRMLYDEHNEVTWEIKLKNTGRSRFLWCTEILSDLIRTQYGKSRIRETPTLSTDADSRTDHNCFVALSCDAPESKQKL